MANDDLLRSLLLLTLQIHRHHSPRQVIHALLVGKLALGFGEELPYLDAQGIFLLHFLRTIHL